MARLSAAPCCGGEWYASAIPSFLRYALRPPPAPEELHRFGLTYSSNRDFSVSSDRERDFKPTIASSAKFGKRVQMALRAISYGSWPLERRVEFFSQTGVSLEELRDRLIRRRVATAEEDVERLMALAIAVAPNQNETYGMVAKGGARRFPRPGELTGAARACEAAAQALDAIDPEMHKDRRRQGGSLSEEQVTSTGTCCERFSYKGANSMTMIRLPYMRAVSAYFYRGHSPNYDNYALRPGLWPSPRENAHFARPQSWTTLREFLWLDEYRNVLTKMFGDSVLCPDVRKCGQPKNRGACAMVSGCHAYRNASSYLGTMHVNAAVNALAKHAFFGLIEAYNASIFLASHTFQLDKLDPEDFAKSRTSASLDRACSPSMVMRLDPTVCREAYRAFELDNMVYERAHRLFCDRLEEAGLMQRKAVQLELKRNNLCGTVDFSNVEHVCAPLETPEAQVTFKLLRAPCKQGTAWWRQKYGFYWQPE